MTNDEKNQVMIAARIAAFKARMDSSEGMWHRDDVLMMICLLLIIGAGDNIAKNFYPYTFGVKKVKDGVEIQLGDKKFRLRNDDLDTIMRADNQGLDRKPYWLEWFDRYADGQYIVNAAEGAFIALWWRAYFNSTTDRGFVIMRQLLAGLEQLGGVTSGSHLEMLLGWYDKYYTRIKEAFPALLVNEDMMRFERARVNQISGAKGEYTEVNPLRQEVGDHYITDRGWMRKRLVYVMSMASFGDFAHNASSGTITFRLNGTGNFAMKPAIKMYPTVTGGQTVVRGARTDAGTVCQMTLSGTDLDSMVNGADWLLDIGEWYNMPIRNNLTVNARMLKQLLLGTADPTKMANMAINISSLTVGNCPSLRVIDVQNIASLTGELSLRSCRLLQQVKAKGSTLTSITLPEGSPLTVVDYPVTEQTIVLKELPLLQNSGVNYMECAESVTMFIASNCPQANTIAMLSDIIEAQKSQGDNHQLSRVYVDGFDEVCSDPQVLDNLLALTDGTYQAVDKDGYDIAGNVVLSGTIMMSVPIYQDTYDALMEAFGPGGLVITASAFYLRFEDSRVWEICAYRWGDTYNIQEVNGAGGVLGSGELEGNNDTLVYSDYMFAATYAIGAHGSVPATAARTVQYRVEIVVEGGRALDGENAPWDIATASAVGNAIFYPVQYGTTMSATALGTITAENWADPTFWASQTILTDGGAVGANARKYTALITTTNACQYLRLGIRAVAGTNISWKFVSVGVTKLPQGITQAQCAAVSSLGTAFRENAVSRNTLIKRFDEYKYFTSITICSPFGNVNNIVKLSLPSSIKSIPAESLYGLSLSESPYFVVPEGCTTYGNHAIGRYNCYIVTLDLPSTSEKFLGYIMYQSPNIQTIILRAMTPPAVTSSTLSGIPSRVQFYVPDASVEAYKTADIWSPYASRIHPMSEYTG